jgi:hypothetical protein
MEFHLSVNQLALRRWFGKIDGDDALLLAFIAGLNADNPRIAKHMKDGFFRLNRTYLKQELPVLSFSEDWISRRMKRLADVGLLDLVHRRSPSGQALLFGRMSKLYWRDYERAKAHADRLELPEDSHTDDCPTGTRDRPPTDDCPTNQYKINEDGDTAPPPLVVGDAGPETSPDRAMTEDEFQDIAQRVPWRRTASTPTVIDFKMRQTGEREEAAV